MIAELDWSNWINIGILVVTFLVGILAYLGAKRAANKAHKDQQEANAAALRSATAAEIATRLQAKIVELEETRQQKMLLDAQKARLQVSIKQKENNPCLTIENHGQAAAQNLSMFISGDSVDNIDEISKPIPIASYTVDPKTSVEILYLRKHTGGLQPPFHTFLEWDDDSGTRGHWEGKVMWPID